MANQVLTDIGGELYVTKEVAAIICGVTTATINNWLKQDNPPPRDPISGQYPIRQLTEWSRTVQIYKRGRGGGLPYLPVQMSDDVPETGTPVSADADAKRQEARYKKAQADKIEMEIAERAGKLVPAEDVLSGWMTIVARVRTKLLGIPTKIAPLVYGEDSVYAVQERLDNAVREVLEELSDDWQDGQEDEDDVGKP